MQDRAKIMWGAGIALLVGAAIIAGCAGPSTSQPDASAGASTSPEGKPKALASGAATLELSGNELWSQNCGQCHNSRSPKDYSDAQWAVAVMHMRIQARLTGEEERKIRQFLQASN
jgi:cytochrome c5